MVAVVSYKLSIKKKIYGNTQTHKEHFLVELLFSWRNTVVLYILYNLIFCLWVNWSFNEPTINLSVSQHRNTTTPEYNYTDSEKSCLFLLVLHAEQEAPSGRYLKWSMQKNRIRLFFLYEHCLPTITPHTFLLS